MWVDAVGYLDLLLRSFLYTLRVSPFLTFKEALRRLAGLPYSVNGVLVEDIHDFRVVRMLVAKGLKVGRIKDSSKDWIVIEKPWGKVAAQKLAMLYSVAAEEIELYEVLEVKNQDVLDVGAFIGDSTVYFANRGARRVYAYEPIYYDAIIFNAKLNKIEGKVIVYPYGVYYKHGKLCVQPMYGGTGLRTGNVCFKVEPLEEILHKLRPSVVKMDCEGCEYSLLATSCSAIRVSGEWLIEIHGSEPIIVDRMADCGFKGRRIRSIGELVSIWHFRRED